MSSLKVTILIPTLNEIEGMRRIMPRINLQWCDQILVVDGNSTDGTVEYAKSHMCDVIVQRSAGLRSAYREGFPHVKGDVIVLFSPDGNSVPELIPALIHKIREGYDMAIGSRYKGGARSYDDNGTSRFGNWLFTKVINLLFGGRYTDALVIFRAIKVSVIKDLGLDKPEPFIEWAEEKLGVVTGWEPQLSMRCASQNFKVAEVPGDEPVRIGGMSKMRHWRSGLMLSLLIVYEYVRHIAS